ncbi:uncharacterized protein [Amphiura filiformis]|uniref:uncharacterized protein n=1 Tax=Amphiura filiformis TaxID=82378 RepID=UPI003B223B8F
MAVSLKGFYMDLPPRDVDQNTICVPNHAEHLEHTHDHDDSHDLTAGNCGEHVLVTGEELLQCDICNKVPPLEDPPDFEEVPERYVAWHAVFNTPLTVAAGGSTQTSELDENHNKDVHDAIGYFDGVAASSQSTKKDQTNMSKKSLRLKLKTLWSSLNIKRRTKNIIDQDAQSTNTATDDEFRSESTDYSKRMSWMNVSLNGSEISTSREYYNK